VRERARCGSLVQQVCMQAVRQLFHWFALLFSPAPTHRVTHLFMVFPYWIMMQCDKNEETDSEKEETEQGKLGCGDVMRFATPTRHSFRQIRGGGFERIRACARRQGVCLVFQSHSFMDLHILSRAWSFTMMHGVR